MEYSDYIDNIRNKKPNYVSVSKENYQRFVERWVEGIVSDWCVLHYYVKTGFLDFIDEAKESLREKMQRIAKLRINSSDTFADRFDIISKVVEKYQLNDIGILSLTVADSFRKERINMDNEFNATVLADFLIAMPTLFSALALSNVEKIDEYITNISKAQDD